MSELANQIQMAQVEAAEDVVVDNLRHKGLLPPKSPTYTLADLESLAEQYQAAKAGDSTEGLRRLFITGWLTWLREREARIRERCDVREIKHKSGSVAGGGSF